MRGFGGKARLVVENYGDSDIARRFGVTRYPAIFVGEVLAATPKDFGFYGKGEGSGDGRYTPWKDPASHQRFRDDLQRMIERTLAGEAVAGRERAASVAGLEPAALPSLSLVNLSGETVTRESLFGRVVLVEFWATWCPPCRGTLQWLGELKRRHGDRLAVLALAVESDEAEVRRLVQGLGLPFSCGMGSPDLARAFGDITAVPTLFLFDPGGRTTGVFYGAPPDLHERAERGIGSLLDEPR